MRQNPHVRICGGPGSATTLVYPTATWAQAQELEPALEQAMEARTAARVAGDSEGWGRYTTDDFIVVGATGNTSNKSQRMEAIERSEGVDRFNQSEETTRIHGDTVIRTVNSGTSPPNRITSVWVNQDNRWRVAHVHVSPIE